jgi:hypothetical protein
MKATATPLQTAYYDLLNGNVTISGNAVPVYDQVPKNPTYPYIQLDSQTAVPYHDKSSFGEEKTITLWIVDRFAESFGSRANLNSIENQILQIIVVRPQPFDLTGFNVIQSVIDISNFTRERTETHTYFRTELRLRHEIEEL